MKIKIAMNKMKNQFNFLVFYILTVLLISCKPDKNNVLKIQGIKSKLSQLKKGDSLQLLDLSNLKLEEIPNLSLFYIEEIDLSNNNISFFKKANFPTNVKKINLKNNKLKIVRISSKDSVFKNLNDLNLSKNLLEKIYVGTGIKKLNISNNDILISKNVTFNHKNLQFLDISNNLSMSNVVQFNPIRIDTIIRFGIENNDPLISIWRKKPKKGEGGHRVKLTDEELKKLKKTR